MTSAERISRNRACPSRQYTIAAATTTATAMNAVDQSNVLRGRRWIGASGKETCDCGRPHQKHFSAGCSSAHDLFGPAFARRSIEPKITTVPGLRAGGKPVPTFPDHALPQLHRRSRQRRDTAEVARGDRIGRRDPRAADRNHVGQRKIGRGVSCIDAAGRTEFELRQRRGDRLEPARAAGRLCRKEFQHREADGRRAPWLRSPLHSRAEREPARQPGHRSATPACRD